MEDASGTVHTFSGSLQRIVSLVPSVSRTVHLLGADHLLVGRTDYDTASFMAHLPSVGGGLHPSLEALVALEPDLVVRFAGNTDTTTPRRLEEMGIPHFSVRPDGIDDIRKIIKDMGRLTGTTETADSLLQAMEETLANVRSRVRGRSPVRVAYTLGGDPPWVAGPGTYIHELITAAGGRNVFRELEGLYGPVSAEELLVRDVDLLLVPRGIDSPLATSGIPVRRVSPDLEIPGPDLAARARDLARVLHPGAFR